MNLLMETHAPTQNGNTVTSDAVVHCAGLSLRSQELTALFLAVRLFCRYAYGPLLDGMLFRMRFLEAEASCTWLQAPCALGKAFDYSMQAWVLGTVCGAFS